MLCVDEEVSGAELFRTHEVVEHWNRHAHLWHGQFSADEWHAVVDVLRVRAERSEGRVELFFRREDGTPVALLDAIALIHPPAEHTLSRYEVLVTTLSETTYELAFPPSSPAGRIIRELAFLPNWRTTMLLLQTVPFLRATGPAIRWHLEAGPFLAGTLLSELDYGRDAPADRRLDLYRTGFDMLAEIPELREQLLLRLCGDVEDLAASAVTYLSRTREHRPGHPRLPAHPRQALAVRQLRRRQDRPPDPPNGDRAGQIDPGNSPGSQHQHTERQPARPQCAAMTAAARRAA